MTETIPHPPAPPTVTVRSIPAEALPLNAALLDRILRAAPRATDDMMTAGVAAANEAPPALGGSIGHQQVRAAWDAMAALLPGLPLAGVEALKQAHERRVADLVDANNAMLERARQAECDVADARADTANAERENMELRQIILRMYAAVMRRGCDLPSHAAPEHLNELTNPIRERVNELMQLAVAPPPTTKQLHAAIEAFAEAAGPFLTWGRGIGAEWSGDRPRSSLSAANAAQITVGHCRRLVATHDALLTQLAVPLDVKWVRRDDLTTADAVRLAGQQVYIRTDNGIWRSRNPRTGGGNGYTSNPAEADTWTFIEAYDQTVGCGPEKEVAFGYRTPL